MTNNSDSGEPAAVNPPASIKPSRPKRGAFPTPKSEIDKAKPYVPDTDDEESRPEGNLNQSTDTKGEKNG
jgi:hypothetical protein